MCDISISIVLLRAQWQPHETDRLQHSHRSAGVCRNGGAGHD